MIFVKDEETESWMLQRKEGWYLIVNVFLMKLQSEQSENYGI